MSPDPATNQDLWNEDLAPTSAAQRTWRWYHFAALWVGMVMCIPAYTLSASLIEAGMSAYQAVFTVFLANAIVLMEQNIEHPLPTPAIALRVGISSRQLERLFLSAFGNTPAKFYLDLRLQQARRLLAETGQSILQIALQSQRCLE